MNYGPPLILNDREIVAVRIRIGRFGRPVLQFQRAVERERIVGPAGEKDCVVLMPWGRTQWRDARRQDAIEVAQFLDRVQSSAATSPAHGSE